MKRLNRLLEDESPLTADEKQLVINLIWLLEQTDTDAREETLAELEPLIETDTPDRLRLVEAVRAAIDELESRSRRGRRP